MNSLTCFQLVKKEGIDCNSFGGVLARFTQRNKRVRRIAMEVKKRLILRWGWRTKEE
jgi:hypothetical protein